MTERRVELGKHLKWERVCGTASIVLFGERERERERERMVSKREREKERERENGE